MTLDALWRTTWPYLRPLLGAAAVIATIGLLYVIYVVSIGFGG